MIRARYRDFIRPDPRRELEDELRFHLEAETEALIAEGLSPAAARQRALAKFGDVDKFLADCGKSDRRRLSRTQRTRVVDALRQDTAYAARALLRRPAFSVTAILVLALGVGANAAVMSVVDHIFLRPPAVVRAPDRLKRVFVERQREDNSTYFQVRFSLPEARIIDSTISSGGAFPSTIFFRRQMPFASTGSTKRSVMSAWVTPSYFSVLGVHLYAGTDFAPEDSRFGVPATSAIVSWALWQRELGGDPNVIGRVVTIDGSPMRIRGIAPRGFVGVDIDVTDVWLPLGGLTAFRTTGQAWYNEWGLIAFRVLARVPDGVDERQLVARVEGAMRIAAEISAREMSRKPPGVRRAIAAPILTSHGPEHASRSEAIAAALAGLALLLFVIAIANVGNLLLGRALDRQRETAVRLALGMGRTRLVGQVVIESTMLAIAASVGSLIAAAWMGGILRSMILPGAELATGPVDPRIALFTLAAAVLAGAFAALVPLAATLRVDLVKMLKGTSRDGGGRVRGRSVLVGVQVALSVTLLVGTGLIARSLYNIRTDNLGLDVHRGVIVQASDSGIGMPLPELARVARALPGVTGAALAAEAPLYSQLGARHLFSIGGDTIRSIESGSGFVAAEPAYLSVVGTRLMRGRNFTVDDRLGATPVMIASDEFARRLWPGRNPLGQCIRIEKATGPCYVVIGVAENARVFDLVEDPRPVFYVPLDQRPDRAPGVDMTPKALVVRSSGDPAPLVARLRALIKDTATTIRTRRVIAMSEVLAPRYEPWELAARMFAGFAILAIVLTVIGLHGVLSYLVSIRRRELGVRMALGASQGRVLAMILREGVGRITIGLAIGVAIALLAARVLKPLLYQVSPSDPLVIGVAVVVLAACAVLASALPARRAMSIDPSSALREE